MKNSITLCLAVVVLISGGWACKNDRTATNTYQNGNTGNDSSGDAKGSDKSGNESVPTDSSPDVSGNAISGGVLNGKATKLVKPVYPAAAKAVRASGAVNVQVTIDEKGSVVAASAVSGHPLLRASAVQAARESTFSPTLLSGKPVKVTGVIVYNFTPE
jgi:TonB family protein